MSRNKNGISNRLYLDTHSLNRDTVCEYAAAAVADVVIVVALQLKSKTHTHIHIKKNAPTDTLCMRLQQMYLITNGNRSSQMKWANTEILYVREPIECSCVGYCIDLTCKWSLIPDT